VGSFFSRLREYENIPLLAASAVIVGIVLAWFSPAEATLGEAVKLVYVHAAIMWVGLGLLTAGGITALVYLVRPRPRLLAWSNGCTATSVGLLLATGLLGMVTARITWGGVNWTEPRFIMLGQILLAGVAAVAIGWLVGESSLSALANLIFAAASWVLIFRTELVMHPASPIFSSDSSAIKIFPLLIAAVLAFAGFQIVRYLINRPSD